jgi:hypothetical protein
MHVQSIGGVGNVNGWVFSKYVQFFPCGNDPIQPPVSVSVPPPLTYPVTGSVNVLKNGNTYEVPALINGVITLQFLIDSGCK